ncbi:MAG: hypothetical protein F6K37_01925 [Moorea sp. SIO4E2]|uniref:hypothetical protein n=1 Tax=Moorena sp. SIO4E2 TaxID=2607826 RepID=UPI0013B767BF|nr:hypothetical protein [Moorena sp. SIO4E2]NEQ04785.1 hypothetical protein [Moorena sp. SIO4E2]
MKSLFNYLQGIRYHSSDSSGASEVNSDWQPLGFNLMGITNLAKATFPILVTGSALLVSTPTEVAGQVGIDASLATGPRPFSLRYSAHVPGNTWLGFSGRLPKIDSIFATRLHGS